MKALNVRNMRNTRQSGFTIIELVVVILLLGILTATALPRFLDVTDEAHDAVILATASGLQTAAALFRAQWVAEGQLNSDVGYGPVGDIDARNTGYPVGTDDGVSIDSSADCLAIYQSLLQVGRPAGFLGTDRSTITNAQITGDANYGAGEILAVYDDNAVDVCSFIYTGQRTLGDPIEIITYDSTAGSVVAADHPSFVH